MMKRIISCVVLISLICSLSCICYADFEETKSVEMKYEVLKLLNIFKKAQYDKYGEYILEEGDFLGVSKNAFINYICNIKGDYGFDQRYNEEAIKIAEAEGLIHKGQNDLYKPINFEEAVTIIVRLLGYGIHAEDHGGWPYGYLAIANKMGISEGVTAKAGSTLQEHEVIQLLYNTINCPYVELKYITNEEMVFGAASDRTLLHEFRGIYVVEGVLEGTMNQKIREDKAVGRNQVMIDGYVYKITDDYTDKLGLNVEAFVQENKEDQDTVLFLTPDKNEEFIIQSESIKSISNDFEVLTYYDDNDRERTVRISPIASVVYNGQPLPTPYSVSKFKPLDGEIRMIDNDNDRAYDVVFITEYTTVVVDGISTLKSTLKNMYTHDASALILDMSVNQDEDFVKIMDELGEKLKFSDIKNGDVLKVVKSEVADVKFINAFVSRNRVSGTVSTIKTNRGNKVIVVDNNEYILSKSYETALAKKDSKAIEISVGTSYVFSLDNSGKIAYVKKGEDVLQYGIYKGQATDGVFEKNYKIKLYTTEGQWEVFSVASKIEYDGTKGKKAEDALDLLQTYVNNNSSNTYGVTLVAYKLNPDGEIRYLDVAETDDGKGNDGEFNTRTLGAVPYRGNGAFNSKWFPEDNAVFMMVKEGQENDDKSYSIVSRSYFTQDWSYNLVAYDLDEFGFFDIAIVKRGPNADSTSLMQADVFMVTDVGQTLNKEGDIVGMVTGMIGSFETASFLCEDIEKISTLSIGDAVSLLFDDKGYITDLKSYCGVEDAYVTYQYATQLHSTEVIIQGRVLKNSFANGRMKIDCGNDNTVALKTSENPNAFIYDLKTKKIYIGAVSDIEEDAWVMMKLRGSRITSFIVYQ